MRSRFEQLEELYVRAICILFSNRLSREYPACKVCLLLLQGARRAAVSRSSASVKGLASVMTAERLSKACARVEAAVKKYAWKEVEELLAPLEEELSVAVNFCKGLL